MFFLILKLECFINMYIQAQSLAFIANAIAWWMNIIGIVFFVLPLIVSVILICRAYRI